MADEARLNELLDLVEQARSEGDSATEQKAMAAYKSESQPAAAAAPEMSTGEKLLDIGKTVGSAIARPVAQAIAAPGNAVVDFAQGAAYLAKKGMFALKPKGLSDLIVDRGPKMPEWQSEGFNAQLDRMTRAPTSKMGKVNEMVASALIGSRIPTPSLGAQAPANFVAPAATAKGATLQAAQDAGLVVPPSSVKPTLVNRMLESFGGKAGTEQDAALKNMPVINSLAKRALGLSDDLPVSKDALDGARKAAGEPYAAIRGAGQVKATPEFNAALDKVVEPFKNAAKDFPGVADDDVLKMADAVRKDSFDSSSAVDALKIIREKASKAYMSGDKTKGGAYRGIADAIENAVETHLEGSGAKELLKQFRDARTQIAKTYSVEKALNPATGNVSGVKLGQQLTRGKPLSGDLLTAGQFGQAFPKAAREMVDSGSVRNTDVALGGAAAILQGQPGWLVYPMLRDAVRKGLLSPAYQKTLLEGTQAPTGAAARAALAAAAAAQSSKSGAGP